MENGGRCEFSNSCRDQSPVSSCSTRVQRYFSLSLQRMIFHYLLCILLLFSFKTVMCGLMFSEIQSSPRHWSKLMNNQHIVMIGDSLMRYQYLSLVHLVELNHFYENRNETNNIFFVPTWKNWFDYYNASTAMFGPNEHCDCFRASGRLLDVYQTTVENRFYSNFERNISITYLNYFGDYMPVHGHWRPGNNDSDTLRSPHQRSIPLLWSYANVTETIVNIAAKLSPKPSVLLLNAGFHANNYEHMEHVKNVSSVALKLFDSHLENNHIRTRHHEKKT